MGFSSPLVLLEKHGRGGWIWLNRPKALNSINIEMTYAITDALKNWRDDDGIDFVVIASTSPKAFCAGGDIKRAYELGKDDPNHPEIRDFFYHEYRLNHMIHSYPKPYIALINGVCMGGGVGLSIYGSHKIVNSSTLFAMPETAIGFFPDIGAAHFLQKAPGMIGTYLALTGDRITGADMVHLGFASHFVPETLWDSMILELKELNAPVSKQTIDALFSRFHHEPPQFALIQHQELIDQAFANVDVSQVIEHLERAPKDSFVGHALQILKSRSPTSLVATRHYFEASKEIAFEAVMERDFRLSRFFIEHPDFYEGVRTVLVDRGDQPLWNPGSLDHMDDFELEEKIARYMHLTLDLTKDK